MNDSDRVMNAWRAYLGLIEKVGGAFCTEVMGRIEDERDSARERVKRVENLIMLKDQHIGK